MNRIMFFVDGFNLYYALLIPKYRKYKWLNYRHLCECFIKKSEKIVGVYYFTAYVPWDTQKILRHKRFVKALESVGVKTVLGVFKYRDRYCHKCHNDYQTWEEKQTDVNIAIKLFQTAMEGIYDWAIIISGDSDLVPAIKALKESFPSKQIGVIIPIGNRSKELKSVADFHMKMKEQHLCTSLFAETVILEDGRKITRPDSWK